MTSRRITAAVLGKIGRVCNACEGMWSVDDEWTNELFLTVQYRIGTVRNYRVAVDPANRTNKFTDVKLQYIDFFSTFLCTALRFA